MRRVAGWTAALVVLATLGAPSAGGARPAQAAPDAPAAWILVDADSGVVLTGSNIHAPQLPASTVKIVTALTAIEILPTDARLTITGNAAAREAMRIDMREGETWQFSDALRSMMMVSANDAAYAIAENAAGSLDGFAARMNNAAQRMGMKDSTFTDPAGLDTTSAMGQPNAVSAYDLAIAARNVLSVPELAALAGTKKASFVDPRGAQRTLTNHVAMLNTYPGATGIKTGYTKRAGRTLVGSATRDGRTMIAAVFNIQDHYGWVSRLLDQGFASAPYAAGTGERLPAPAIIPEAVRAIVPGGSIPRVATSVVTPPTSAPSIPTSSTLSPTNARDEALIPGNTWTLLGGGGVVVIGGAVFWRRSVIKRRRRARRSRQRRVELARGRAARRAIDLGRGERRGMRL